ncbi:MAG: potassium channel family protein, partial [Nitrososphaeraceae archaeon]|nr:potassium channel family protein [Nitrososphaeraceae archaeon]
MADNNLRQLFKPVLLFFLVIFSGTVGFMLIEGWGIVDAIYMTIITVTTTGFEEVHPLSKPGEIFTLFLALISFATVLYIGGTGIQILIETKFFRRRKMYKRINDLSNHYIVCGYGRMGTHICNELSEAKVPFVVVENNINNKEKLDAAGLLYDTGDASQDITLQRVGIKKAKGIVIVLSTDAEN